MIWIDVFMYMFLDENSILIGENLFLIKFNLLFIILLLIGYIYYK